MADEKIKVWNRSKGNHGYLYSDRVRSVLIPAGAFVFLPRDEVYYTDASTRSFKKGILEIDHVHVELREELGYTTDNPNALSEADMEQLLKGNLSKEVKEKLGNITEKHAQDRLIAVARKLDLSQSKIRFIEEITGRKVFNELVEAIQAEETKKKK